MQNSVLEREKIMKRLAIGLGAAVLALTGAVAQAGETPAPDGVKLYFVNLKDGDTVKSPVTIQFGLSGMGVAPAGTEKENTGHHHLIIDESIEGEELNEAIPADDNHKHFGGGQTETTIELPAGSHTLQLVLGDWSHIPHNPPVMSEKITITVE
ncbi:rod shape-determining protein RodA [Labrenzia sp. C1B70]|nr:rod shape-determining protein RodA [Labrenzia sp. C1B70]